MTKDTDQLKQELFATTDLEHYLKANDERFVSISFTQLLEAAFQSKGMAKSQLAKASGVSEPYLHQLFSGRRSPSRNKLICLALGLGSTVDECQQLLKTAGFAQLYPANRRDSIILFGVLHSQSVWQVNDKLYAEAEETLI